MWKARRTYDRTDLSGLPLVDVITTVIIFTFLCGFLVAAASHKTMTIILSSRRAATTVSTYHSTKTARRIVRRVRACTCYSLALWTTLTWTVRSSSQAFSLSPTTTNHQLSAKRDFSLFFQSDLSSSFSSSASKSTATRSNMSNTAEDSTVTEADIEANLKDVLSRIATCCEENGRKASDVRLVAVSKTKPLELVEYAYKSGHRVFGENYVQELVEKAADMEQYKDDIQWHFIGSLQSNKASMLVKGVVPYGKLVVETVGSLKVANKLDTAMSEYSDDGSKKLEVFVQINTSGEDSKSGIEVDDKNAVIELCKHIVYKCDNLSLKGLMTIGAPGDDSCLEKLVECRTFVATALDMDDPKQLELSMGMSADQDEAIAKGSTNVRVGSAIFGARDYSNRK